MDNFIENSNSKGNNEISLVKYFNIIKNEKRFIIFLVIIGSLIGAGYSLIKKPVWKGNFKVVVKDNNKLSSSNKNLGSSLNLFTGLTSTVTKQTKLEILKSPSVLKPVYEFAKNDDQKLNLSFDNWVAKKLKIKYKFGTDIFIVEYQHSDKEHILSTLNQIKKRYKDYSVLNKKREISESIKFLKNKKKILSEKYEKSLLKFNKFSIENGLGNVDGFIKLTKINDSNNDSSKSNSAGQRYALQFATLERYEARFENLSSKLKPNSQTIIDLKKDIDNLKKALERPNEILLQFRELQSKANRNQKLLYDVITNLELTKLAAIKELVPWDIISPPTIEELRISPKRKQIVLTSFLASILLSSIIAIIKDKKKGIIFEKEDFERPLNLTFNDYLDYENLKLNTLILKKYLTNLTKGEGIAILNLKDDDIDSKKYKYFSEDFKSEFISLNKLEELENFQSVVLIANSGKFKSKNLYIINKYLNIYKNRIKASFFVKQN